MTMKHVTGDFSPKDFDKDFGFHGSASGTGKGDHHSGKKPSTGYAKGGSTQGPDSPDTHDSGHSVEESNRYARGGMAHGGEEGAEIADEEDAGHFGSEPGSEHVKPMAHGGHLPRHATHAHPHGHHPTHESSMGDGSLIQHHAHGGFTIHHASGGVTHCASGGHPVNHGEAKGMLKNAFKQHENAEHGGEHEELHLARGGFTVPNQKVPRAVKPHASHHMSPMGDGNPTRTPTPRQAMPGGTMPMGVEPSDEPDTAGADQTGLGGAMMRKGGRSRA